MQYPGLSQASGLQKTAPHRQMVTFRNLPEAIADVETTEEAAAHQSKFEALERALAAVGLRMVVSAEAA